MTLDQPFPNLSELIATVGEVGQRLSDLKAAEGAAGNISILIGWPLDVRRLFPLVEPLELPQPAPALGGKQIIVTGSGRRLRDIQTEPAANLGVVAIDEGGQTARLFTSPARLFKRVTGEFNSHLAVHADQVTRTGTNFLALIHAQPPNLVYLSHIPRYRDRSFLSKRLMRWEPETIVQLPEGIAVLPFMPPGSQSLMEATVTALRDASIVLWSKHGVMARSDLSATRAADHIEYAEIAARYEYMDLAGGGRAEGLTDEELRAVVAAFQVRTDLI